MGKYEQRKLKDLHRAKEKRVAALEVKKESEGIDGFLSNLESLGPKFEDVYFRNAWDLYEEAEDE